MSTVTLDITQFREGFPAFSNETLYPDTLLNTQWAVATCFLSCDTNSIINETCLTQLLNLMLAHLLFIYGQVNGITASGDTIGTNNPQIVKSATIDDTSVTVEPPPFGTDQFAWWMNKSPYGEQAYAMLGVLIVGGFYVGPSDELDAFRKVNGNFAGPSDFGYS